MEKNDINNAVEIITDEHGKNIVKINHIIFRGKQNIDWNAVEVYLQKYNGKILDIASEKIEINKTFPNEYTGSLYTKSLKGGLAKAKANASQGIIEMAKIAVLKRKMENKKETSTPLST